MSTWCLHCKKTFSSTRAQLSHVCGALRAKLDKDGPHCRVCHVHFSTYREYVQHCGRVHGVIVGSPRCPYCSKVLASTIACLDHQGLCKAFLELQRKEKEARANNPVTREVTIRMQVCPKFAGRVQNYPKRRDVIELMYRFGITDIGLEPGPILKITGAADAVKKCTAHLRDDLQAVSPWRQHPVLFVVQNLNAKRFAELTLDSEQVKLMSEATFMDQVIRRVVKRKIDLKRLKTVKVQYDEESIVDLIFSELVARSEELSRIVILVER